MKKHLSIWHVFAYLLNRIIEVGDICFLRSMRTNGFCAIKVYQRRRRYFIM